MAVAVNCLAGCINNYKCGNNTVADKIIDGHSLSPWVIVTFGSSNLQITVGNESAPVEFDNHAAIKAFEYGVSNGHIATIEVVDEAGGAFNQFVDAIVKCLGKADVPSVTATLSWGWTISNCTDSLGSSAPTVVKTQVPVVVTLMDIQVQFSTGVVKYIITGTDAMQVAFHARAVKVFGTLEHPISLKAAIEQLAQDCEPKLTVKYMSFDNNGNVVTGWNFEQGQDGEGPTGTWAADNQNKLSVIQNWVKDYCTSNKRGIFVTVDNTQQNAIILWEEPPQDSMPNCAFSLGTFIVNGGSCSNVLDFAPEINWVAAFAQMGVGGGMGGGDNAAAVEIDNKERPNDENGQPLCAGISSGTTTNIKDKVGPKVENMKHAIENQQINAQANARFGSLSVINANLRIQGNPATDLVDVRKIAGRFCSIVVINPFFISPISSTSTSCGDWLARPGCNVVLSNKHWMVMGVDHTIRDGSYTTTLRVTLTGPNLDAVGGAPLGGFGSGGYTPAPALTC